MTETTTTTPEKPRYMPPARKRQLLAEMALGGMNYGQLAAKFGVSRDHIKHLAISDREEIESIKGELTEREKLLWPVDRYSRNLERVTDLSRIEEEMAKHETVRDDFGEIVGSSVPLSEQWLKLMQQKQMILRAIQEDYAQVPLRVPAHRLGLLPNSPLTVDTLPATLQVYPEWNPAIHLINPFEIPDGWARWWGVDFGFDHPFVWGNFAESPRGVLYLTQEIHRTRTVEEDHAREIVQLTVGQRAPQAMVCDHDPSGQATLVRHMSEMTGGALSELRVVSAYKDVAEGIAAVRGRLRAGRLCVFRDAVARPDLLLLDSQRPASTAEEFETYIQTAEGPVKENDDGMDMLRYVVAQIDLMGG